VRKRPNCGTHAGYNSHRYYKEIPCELCVLGHKEYLGIWREGNRERAREISKSWDIKNPEYVRQRNNKNSRTRRALLAGVEKEDYTTNQITDIYGTLCHICLEQIDMDAPRKIGGGEGWKLGLNLDHLIPISKGGSDTLSNIRPAHAICNITRSNKDIAPTNKEESREDVFV
jgi:5-methylcytosine-specific restriction endonuclease McrA